MGACQHVVQQVRRVGNESGLTNEPQELTARLARLEPCVLVARFSDRGLFGGCVDHAFGRGFGVPDALVGRAGRHSDHARDRPDGPEHSEKTANTGVTLRDERQFVHHRDPFIKSSTLNLFKSTLATPSGTFENSSRESLTRSGYLSG